MEMSQSQCPIQEKILIKYQENLERIKSISELVKNHKSSDHYCCFEDHRMKPLIEAMKKKSTYSV